MPGQRAGLVADALRQVAVGADGEDPVVAHVGAEAGPQVGLGDGHADAVGEPLAERPGGHLDARRVAVTNRPPVHPLADGARKSLTSGVALSTFSLLDHAALNWGAVGDRTRSAVRWAGKRMSHATNLTYVSTGGVRFAHEELDYAMSAISHRIMRAQDWTAIAERRRRNYTLMADLLSDVAPPTQGDLPDGVVPLFYATNVENKRAVLLRLSARGVEGRNFWELHHPDLAPGVFPEQTNCAEPNSSCQSTRIWAQMISGGSPRPCGRSCRRANWGSRARRRRTECRWT